MQTSGNIVVNGVTYTLRNTYEFNANVSGNASSDGSGATALSLDALKSNYSDYAAYYPKMRVMYYNAGAKYPYALYYPSGFWGGALHGWFPASIFKAQAFTLTSSCTARTETTATFKWSIGTDVTGIWYSTNGGSSYTYGGAVSGKSGTYTIKGLSPNTKYTVKLRVKRKVNSVQVTGSSLSVTTYAYPYASSMPDFYIGDKVTIGIYNPLKRSVTIKMQTTGGTSIYNATATTTGTSITLAAASFDKSAMYKNIPNAQYAQYKIAVTYGSNTTTKTGGYYRIKSGSLTPTIGTVSYKDTNSTTTAITGNNQELIRNKSIPSFTVTGLAATTSATISKCTVAVSGETYTLTVSGTTASGTGGVINSATNVKAVVTLTDSRGLTATKEVTLLMLDWYAPTATVTAKRQDGYYSETDLLVNANYAELDGKNSVTISYTATSTGGTKVSGTLTDGATGIATLDNGYAWMIVFTITDILGGTITYTKSIEKGVPIIFFDRNKYAVGVNCFPSDKALEVDGNVAFSGDIYLNGSLMDYVVAYQPPTNDSLGYRRWRSGYIEIFGTRDFSGVISNTWGSLYYSNIVTTNFPLTLLEVSQRQISVQTGDAWAMPQNVTTNQIKYYLVSATKHSTAITTKVHIWIAGRVEGVAIAGGSGSSGTGDSGETSGTTGSNITKVSQLENDSGYITADDIPKNISVFTNDSNYVTTSALTGYAKTSDMPTKVSELTNDSSFITVNALTEYAKTSDIPTNTSTLTNDSGFITASEFVAYTSAEIQTAWDNA